MPRRIFRVISFMVLTVLGAGLGEAQAQKEEIKIGAVFPFSGPASAIGVTGKGVMAYVQAINDRGGVNGRKINYIALDDNYSPPKTVEHVRKLIELDDVLFMFGHLGTPGLSATAKYVASKKVPNLGIVSGSHKFTDVKTYPQTTTSLVDYDTEGKIYAKYLAKAHPGGKYAVLYQNDDLGKDYLAAFKDYFKVDFGTRVASVSYELTDPTVDSQIATLRNSGAVALLIAGTPKFAAQAIRKVADLDWKPTVIINYPSSSIAATLKPAGLDKSVGVVSATILKEPLAAAWEKDAGIIAFKQFADKYLPGADIGDSNYLFGYTQGLILEHILKQCGDDVSRANVLKQAQNIKDLILPTAMPGIKVNTSPTSNANWTQMQLQRWSGSRWEQLGGVLDAKSE